MHTCSMRGKKKVVVSWSPYCVWGSVLGIPTHGPEESCHLPANDSAFPCALALCAAVGESLSLLRCQVWGSQCPRVTSGIICTCLGSCIRLVF